jgi:hypothetical protein
MGPGGMRSLMSSSHQQSDPFSRNRAERDSGEESGEGNDGVDGKESFE